MIETIRVSNIGPFAGTQEIQLPEGLVLIEGRYTDSPLRSNRAGKSYVLDLIRFGLYGKFRHDTRDKLIHRKANPKTDLVEVSLVLSHSQLERVSLSRTYDSVSGRYNITSPQFDEDLRQLKIAEQQTYLDNLMSCTYDEAEISWMVRQGDSAGIMRMTLADRKTFLLDMFSPVSYPWQTWYTETSSRFTTVSARLLELRNQHSTWQQKLAVIDINVLNTKIFQCRQERKKLEGDKQTVRDELVELRAMLDPERIKRIRQKKDQLNEQKIKVGANLAAIRRQADQLTIKIQEMSKVQDAYAKANKALETAKKKYDEQAVNQVRSSLTGISRTLMEKGIQLKDVNAKLVTMQSFVDKGSVCPVIGAPCEYGSSIKSQYTNMFTQAESLEFEINKLEQQHTKYSEALQQWEDLMEEISLLENNITSFKAQLSTNEMLFANREMLTIQILERETEHVAVSVALEETEKELKDALAQDDFQPRKRIVELTEYTKELDKQIEILDNDVATYQGDIKYSERIQQNIELVYTEIQTLEKRMEALSSLRMALSKNGIPFFSLVESIHIFELEVNKALYQLGTNIRIGIEAYKTLSSYDDICHACGYKFSDSKNTCIICGTKRQYKRQETLAVQMQGVSFNVDFLEDSGGGMLLVSLAIRLALFSIFRERGRMQDIDFWFLDEVFSPLDVSARNNMLQFLDDLRDTYGLSQLFLISHTDMSDILQPAITVERNEEAEESYIIA